MKPGQEAIYYLSGTDPSAVAQSPHLEAFRAKGYEVLYLTDPVDELWGYGRPYVRGEEVPVGGGRGKWRCRPTRRRRRTPAGRREAAGDFAPVLTALKAALADDVKEVRLSTRLVSSPACLVGEERDLSPHLDELMRKMGHAVERKKAHPGGQPEARADREAARPARRRRGLAGAWPDSARLIYGQALLAEGSPLPGPGRLRSPGGRADDEDPVAGLPSPLEGRPSCSAGLCLASVERRRAGAAIRIDRRGSPLGHPPLRRAARSPLPQLPTRAFAAGR